MHWFASHPAKPGLTDFQRTPREAQLLVAPHRGTRRFFAVAGLGLATLLGGCGAGSTAEQAAVTNTVTAVSTMFRTVTAVSTVTATPDSTQPPAAPDAVDVGVKTTSGGIDIVVNSFATVPNYTTLYNQDEETVQPRQGAKFVRVETTVVNNRKGGIDLTCSYPVAAKVVDINEREFDPVDDLYKLPGNPGCNDQLQPGFDSQMTWIYEVPASADILAFGFQDVDLERTLPSDAKWALVNAPEGL